MTLVKICGITNLADALAAVEAGVDMLGFLFADSPRRIDAGRAREIIAKLPLSVTPVAVCMNQLVAEVIHIVRRVGARSVQLHGDEPADTGAALPCDLIRRIIVRDGDQTADLIARMARFPGAAMFLLDPGAGSGKAFPWDIARGIDQRVCLAGGLNSRNVADAIRAARPTAVDVSSGVESSPGRKDRSMMIDFIQAVRSCDDERPA